MNFNLINSLILAGIIQGIIFACVVVASKKYRARSTRFLAALILCFSLSNLQYYLSDTKIITTEQLYSYIYIPWALLTPAIFLFFALHFLNPDRTFENRDRWFFAPFMIGVIGSIVYKILCALDMRQNLVFEFLVLSDILAEIFSLLYSQGVTIYLLVKVHKSTNISSSPAENRTVQHTWLKWILWTLLLLSFVWMWMLYLMLIGTASQQTFYPLWLGMSIMIYWLGHIGIYKFGIQQERKQLRSYSIKTKIYPVAEKQKNEHIVTIEKLVKKEKRYLDASLTLDKIAEELNLSKSHLSRIINSELGTGFPEYINSLRVEEAKHYLNNPAFANYTLVAIGLEAGFNSKTTFNNAFKKATGLTPSEFKNQCELSTDN